jgi:putative ABC transport system permease protein
VNAVWRMSRAGIRRRRLQTIVIGVVVGVSTATIVLALGLLAAATAPFDDAHAAQNGAHLVAAFDNTKVSDAQLSQAASRGGAEAVAGPFGRITIDTTGSTTRYLPPSVTTVGRADPGGPVDQVNVWQGRWATAPGEIVLNRTPRGEGPAQLGTQISIPGLPVLTVVGFAYSVSGSADAWVTPDQMTALKPTATQMLYRFPDSATVEEISAGQAAVTNGLAADALLGAQSYLTLKQEVTSQVGVYIPFLAAFGFLGLAVAVLIVANVISGAVVAGFRHIGVLKAIGFTSNQVMAVYLVMVTIPAVIGCVVGVFLGNLVARPMLEDAFETFGTSEVSIDLWVYAAALLGMPVVVVITALLSALRARRLPAAEAISAGSAPRVGRALVVQRWLSGTRLPRSVSLGLGVPFARPARSMLTLAAVMLGVMTVTLAIGVTMSVTAYQEAVQPTHTDRVELLARRGEGGGMMSVPSGGPGSGVRPKLGDLEDEALLRSLSGTVAVAAVAQKSVHIVGGSQSASIWFYRGDTEHLGPQVLKGQRPDGPGQVSASPRLLNQRGLALGDTITVELNGQRAQMRIVGVVLTNNPDVLYADWDALAPLDPGSSAGTYHVQLAPGTNQQAYLDSVKAGDPGLVALPPRDGGSTVALVIISSATLLTLVLGAVAALGVFNTVVLNARERRRDLGMLKSIGMTPRQVTVMMVTSMGGLGVVGGLLGLPLGIAAHQLVVAAMLQAGQADVIDIIVNVYRAPLLVALALAGIAIAVLGALIPARAAARTTIASVLHNE